MRKITMAKFALDDDYEKMGVVIMLRRCKCSTTIKTI